MPPPITVCEPYWSSSGVLRVPAPVSVESADWDCVVVGGGIMGAAVTYWLARSDVKVCLLEREEFGCGASCRNAGVFLPASIGLENISLLSDVLNEERIDAELEITGHLSLANNAEIWARIVSEADRCPTRIQALDPDACEDLLGFRIGRSFVGGRWFSGGAVVHPRRLLSGLLHAAVAHGASLFANTEVEQVRRSKSHKSWKLSGPRGDVRGRQVVIANQHAAPVLVPEIASVLHSHRGQVISTSALPPTFRFGMAVNWGDVYWRQTRSGEVVIGGLNAQTENLTDSLSSDKETQEALADFLRKHFPDLPEFKVERRWTGIMDEVLDSRPLVGEMSPGLWGILGFGGHGLPSALGFARALVTSILDGTSHPDLFHYRPDRFVTLHDLLIREC